jgi:hypothetical protein
MVQVPELDLLTQARRLAEVDRMARSIISFDQETDRDSFDLNVQIRLDEDTQAAIDDSRRLRADAEEANRAASASAADAARALSATGMPRRDVGAMRKVSYQRAQQLVHT